MERTDCGSARIGIYTSAPYQTWKGNGVNEHANVKTFASPFLGPHGTHINAPDFVKVAECVGGYREKVTDPENPQDALKQGLEANRSGKPAIIDVSVA